MDLVAGVRKEGSRGGRGEFKWSDVKDSAYRENYLGHSLMAPVGRWQQNRDLNWYAKGDVDGEEERARKQREELQRVKEAEEEAMARALGLPIPPKVGENANLIPLGGQSMGEADQDKPMDRDVKSASHTSRKHRHNRSRSPRRERRSYRSGEQERDRDHKHRKHHDDRIRPHHSHRRRSRSRSRGRDHRGRRRSYSPSRNRNSWRDDEHHRLSKVKRRCSPTEKQPNVESRKDLKDYDRRH